MDNEIEMVNLVPVPPTIKLSMISLQNFAPKFKDKKTVPEVSPYVEVYCNDDQRFIVKKNLSMLASTKRNGKTEQRSYQTSYGDKQ